MSSSSLIRLPISREMIDTNNNKIILPNVLPNIFINGCRFLPTGNYDMFTLNENFENVKVYKHKSSTEIVFLINPNRLIIEDQTYVISNTFFSQNDKLYFTQLLLADNWDCIQTIPSTSIVFLKRNEQIYTIPFIVFKECSPPEIGRELEIATSEVPLSRPPLYRRGGRKRKTKRKIHKATKSKSNKKNKIKKNIK